MTDRYIALFALLIIPIANWQRWILPTIPNYYLQHLLFYVCAPMLLHAWWRGIWSPYDAWQRARPMLPLLAVILPLQAYAFWMTAAQFAPEKPWMSVLASLLKLCSQLPFLLFFMEVCHVLVQEKAWRRNVLFGACGSFVALITICTMQGIYIYAQDHGFISAASLARYAEVLKHIASVFESRWIGGVYDFYAKGTYALTVYRINGFFEEASALASILGVFYIPLGIGLLHLGRHQHSQRTEWAGVAIVLVSCTAMVLARSSTGLGLALVGMVLLGGSFTRKASPSISPHQKYIATGGIVLTIILLGSIAVSVPSVSQFFVQRLNYGNIAHLPRVVVTREVLALAANHPLTGVGRGNISPHVLASDSFKEHAGKDTELSAWQQQGKLVILSVLPEALAEYGIPLVAAGMALLARLWQHLRRLQQHSPHSARLRFAATFCSAWCIMFLAASPGSHDIRNPLISLPLFLFIALARTPLQAPQASS